MAAGEDARLRVWLPPAIPLSRNAGTEQDAPYALEQDRPMGGLLTVGHGTLTERAFLALLGQAGVDAVVDIRIGPGSRRSPHLGRVELERWLPGAGVSYRWAQRLGGFRKLPKDSIDVALRNDSSRAYASHMRTEQFETALAELVSEAPTTAIMCSESVWWRCHRRLVADRLVLIEGLTVRHLMPDGRLMPHRPTSGVRVCDGQLVYDATNEER